MSPETDAGNLPAALGFAMPPEWRPHAATWLSWPKDPITWPDRVPQVEEIFLHLIALLGAHERVDLLVDEAATEQIVKARLAGLGADQGEVRFHRVKTSDSWIRDYGPNFLLRESDGQLAVNDWIFNAWGDKYEELKRDSGIPEILAGLLGLKRFTPGIVLEGGSIDVNGAGTCMTTEQCLLNRNRNPRLSKPEIEKYLSDYLGVRQVLWLGEGIVGDDTDGHIDDIARFVSPDTIVCAVEEDPSDPNFALLQDNLERLKEARDPNGRPFRIVTLPMPGPIQGAEGRLPASYANFYIANQLVLVPTFDDRNDAEALRVLTELFPDRKVTGIHSEPLVWGLGTLHCVTQQQPAVGPAVG
jgi:agmatine deiminase